LQPDQQQAQDFAGVLERVHAEPRIVLAQPLDVLSLADRDISVEPYIYSVLYREGKWDPAPLIQEICAGQVGLLVLDHPLEGPDWEYRGSPQCPAPVLSVRRPVMRREQTRAGLYLYPPAPDAASSACPSAS